MSESCAMLSSERSSSPVGNTFSPCICHKNSNPSPNLLHLTKRLPTKRTHPLQEKTLPDLWSHLREEDDLRLDTAMAHYIEFVLELCDGNITQAAKRLGITRQTLRRRRQRSHQDQM
ncbi:MAG TPA: hypothetical protein DCE42_00605 [Myxococcales bacterium]|nr:hypothetical protein [Deltaproteobacteria bacterium]HAA53219.1 hypothetical protein [Myxococcales bacterium]